jgi:DDE superfamily endonuclease
LKSCFAENKRVRYFCQDESRFGLKTIQRRKITLKGVKPVGKVQWSRETFYVYGVVEPVSGESFFYEFSHLDSDCFQIFIDKFSVNYADSLNIIQMDNSRCHTTERLEIPENVIFLFQPAYSPELNPIERVWRAMKDKLCWELYGSLQELRDRVYAILRTLSCKVIASLAGWDYITDALRIAKIK